MPELQTKQANIQKPLVDFDTWSELAQSDPEAFEARRAEIIEQMIQRMPAHKHHHMRCLQWKIDRVRDKMATPLAACVAISDMMWDSLDKLNQLYHDCESVTSGKDGKPMGAPIQNAKIMYFSPRQ